jgi:hypothetical protein
MSIGNGEGNKLFENLNLDEKNLNNIYEKLGDNKLLGNAIGSDMKIFLNMNMSYD